MARALILVEGSPTGNGLLYLQAAQRLELHPIILTVDPAQYECLAAERIEAIVRVDTNDLHALIRECSRLREIYDIAGITCARESVCATVGKLCRYFGLPGPNPTSIERCCDKFVQRQLLADADVQIPAFRLAVNATDVESTAAEIGLPVILKPVVGNASYGVRLCRDLDELAEHTTYLLGGKHIWRSEPRILVEEFVQGPLYVANLMGNEVVGITAYEFCPPPQLVSHEYSCPAPLFADEHERIAHVSLNCLRALGLGWGPSNIEFRWTRLGPVVIEVNPRMAGGDSELIQLSYGVDLFTEHIKLVIGEEWDVRKKHAQASAMRYLVPERDGMFNWIDGGTRAAALPGVEVNIFVEPTTPIVRKGDHRDYIGYVVATSPSRAQTAAILRRAVDLIDWSITPFPPLADKT
ncbi:ATP-grasp domain-containing protein [Mesorhizobium sp. RIZ17]|uniref:ATP-grasp domain-containing protein n=1 Tax=Mesorhizobium sp. RIZ17 TaxID=3132743 RepID=UPI003DA92A96